MKQSIMMIVYWNFINIDDLKLTKKCNFTPNAVYSKCIYQSEKMRYIHRCKEVTRACYESEVQERQIIAEILQGLIFSKQTNIYKSCKN